MELNYILYIIIVPPFNHTLSVCQGQQHPSLQSHTSPATVAVGCYSHAFVFVHHAAIRLPYIVPQVTSSGQQPLTGVAPWRQQANKTNQSPVRLGDVGMSGAVISSCRQLLPVVSDICDLSSSESTGCSPAGVRLGRWPNSHLQIRRNWDGFLNLTLATTFAPIWFETEEEKTCSRSNECICSNSE